MSSPALPVRNANGKASLSQGERDTMDWRRLQAEMRRLQAASIGSYKPDPDAAWVEMVRAAARDSGVALTRAQELLRQFDPDDPLIDRLLPAKRVQNPAKEDGKGNQRRKARSVQHSGPVAAADPYPHIPAGEYLLRCIEAKCYRDPQFRRQVCRLAFSSPNVHDGIVIFGFLNLGTGEQPSAGRRSRYWKAWIKANGGKTPARGQSMTADIFEGLWCKVTVRDVVLDSDKNEHPAGSIYSTVRDILEASRA